MPEKKKPRSLSLWDPFEELDLLDPFRTRSPRWRLLDEVFPQRGRGQFVPAVDISEDDDHYNVTVELPGMKKEDVTVESQDNVLTIRGEKRSEREEKKEQNRWVERTYGSFSRSFTLPANAAGDRISASFKDGVLTIAVPKLEEKKPQTISIK